MGLLVFLKIGLPVHFEVVLLPRVRLTGSSALGHDFFVTFVAFVAESGVLLRVAAILQRLRDYPVPNVAAAH